MARPRTRLQVASDARPAAPVNTMRLHPLMPSTVRSALMERRVDVVRTRGEVITEVFVRNHPIR